MDQSITAILFPVLLIVIFYFLLIRPQKKREKKITQMRSSLKVGDKVITIGGFNGTVTKLTDEVVTIKVKPDDVKLEVSRWAISSNESQVEAVVEPKKAEKTSKTEEKIDPAQVVDAEIVDETTVE